MHIDPVSEDVRWREKNCNEATATSDYAGRGCGSRMSGGTNHSSGHLDLDSHRNPLTYASAGVTQERRGGFGSTGAGEGEMSAAVQEWERELWDS